MKQLIWIFLILLVGCSSTGNTTLNILPNEESSPMEVYFCPQDDCQGKLIELINKAESSIHCAFFDLNLLKVSKALAEKSKTIDVKVIIDKDNDDGLIQGIKTDTSRYFMHNKFCIVDKKEILTGSFNPTERGNFKNNNNILILESKYLSQNYEDEFQELWNGIFNQGEKVSYPVIILNNKKIENYFCPEDDCSSHIINVLQKAKKSIYFMTFSFTHEEIADALLFTKTDIKGVFEKFQAGSKYSQYHRFNGFGLDVIKDNNPANMHNKVFIIDEKIVITGSFNPSKNADNNNDENILIIHDREIAKKYMKEFWNIYTLKPKS